MTAEALRPGIKINREGSIPSSPETVVARCAVVTKSQMVKQLLKELQNTLRSMRKRNALCSLRKNVKENGDEHDEPVGLVNNFGEIQRDCV